MLLLAGLLLFHRSKDRRDVFLGRVGIDKTKSRYRLVVPFGRRDQRKARFVVHIGPVCVIFGLPTQTSEQNTGEAWFTN